MQTILILADALAKVSNDEISRLDLQYNGEMGLYVGHLTLMNTLEFKIYEDGTICKE